MTSSLWFAAAWLLGGLLFPLHAQQVVYDPEYVITNWQSEQGLPENSATAMVQTPDGYLWFGTFNGLVRFDGTSFVPFMPQNLPEVKNPAVINLYLDRTGRLWASTADGMLCRQGNRWSLFGSKQGWAGQYARWFAETPDGTLYVSTFDGFILRFVSDHFEKLPAPCDFGKGAHFCYSGADGNLHVIRGECAAVWNNHEWLPESLGSDWNLGPDHRWGVDQDGKLLQTSPLGLRILDQGRIVRSVSLPGRLKDFWSIHRDSRGNLWFCSFSSGLIRIAPDGHVRHFSSAGGLPVDAIRFVFEDRERNLWVGTSGGGLLRFRLRRFLNYGFESGLPRSGIKSVAVSRAGNVYAGTFGSGVFEIREGMVSRLFRGDPQVNYAQSLLIDRKDRLWIGTYQYGLHISDGTRLLKSELQGSSIASLFEDSAGRVWISTSNAAMVAENDVFRAVPTDQPAGGGALLFAEDAKTGTLWAAGRSSLLRWDGSRFAKVPVANGDSITDGTCLMADDDGVLWMGTATHGLYFRQGSGAWISLLERGLPERAVAGILRHSDYLWLATHRGIWRAPVASAVAAAQGKDPGIIWQVFGLSDGLASMQCPVGYNPTLARDGMGRLWFSTLKGLASVDPDRIETVPGSFPLYVEEIRYVGRDQRERRAGPDELKSFLLPSGSRNIEISYTALDFSAPERVLFSYQLWRDRSVVSSGQRHDRKIQFHQLEPGHYRFVLHARNSDGVWSERATELSFAVQPFYWQTLWFQVLAVMLGAGLIVGATWVLSHARLRREREQLERERQVAELQARLALVLENTNDAVVFSGADQRIFYLNPSAKRVLGYAEEELPATAGLSEIIAESCRDLMISRGLRAAATEGFWQGYGALKHRNGREIPVWQLMLAHRKADGSIDFISAIARDMTELKAAEDALRASEEKFSKAFHASPDALVIARARDEILIEVNEGFERLFGYTMSEAVGKSTADLSLYPSVSERRRLWERMRAMGRVREWKGQFRRRDGSVRTCLLSGEQVEIHGEAHAVCIVHDITDHLRMEEQVRQAQKMETVGQLAGGVAHDFNNLLQVIQGHGEMARESAITPAQRDEHLQQVLGAVARASQLTRQLLAFGRRQSLRIEDTDLTQLVAEHLRMIRRVIVKHIRMEFIPGCDIGNIRCDHVQVEQVLLNLCVNARDAMPGGGKLTIEIQNAIVESSQLVSHPWVRPGRYVLLSVADSGSGMDQETCDRIFEPFFTTKSHGTGLGLSVVYGIVRQHEGMVQVQSTPGVGTCFKVYFPVTAAESAAQDTDRPVPAKGGSETILLAEDEAAVRGLTRTVLEKAGYTVLVAKDGEEAVRLFRENVSLVKLAILDVVMPGLGGREAAREIKGMKPDVPVLFCSGYSGDASHLNGACEVGSQVIRKPYLSEDLLRRVRDLLDA